MPRKVDKRRPETIIAELRANLRDAIERCSRYDKRYAEERSERLSAEQMACDLVEQHRQVSYAFNEAKAEAADWKRRFDALLEAIPELREWRLAQIENGIATVFSDTCRADGDAEPVESPERRG